MLRALLCAVVSGIVIALLAEAPYGGWWQILALSTFWFSLNSLQIRSGRNYFALGVSFGLAYFICSLWWIYISLHDVGGLSWPLAGFGVFALSAYLSLFFGVAALLAHYLTQTRSSSGTPLLLNALLFASAWAALEFLRGLLFTGFPWSGFAESQVNGPFGVIAPWFGASAITFAVFAISYLIANLSNSFLKMTGLMVGAVVCCQILGFWQFTQAYETRFQCA